MYSTGDILQRCQGCGGSFIGSHTCNTIDFGQWQRQLAPPSSSTWIPSTTTSWPVRQCSGHCFCIEMTPPRSQKPHLECCKCADRKLKV